MGRIVGKIPLTSMINLKDTLKGGQSFRFRFSDGEKKYCGVAKGILFGVSEPSTSNELEYQVYGLTKERWDYFSESNLLRTSYGFCNFFQRFLGEYLGIEKNAHSLQDSITEFSKNISMHSPQAFQVKVLAQERFETLIAFITSANNNIERITKLVSKFSEEFGEEIYPIEIDNKEELQIIEKISPDFSNEHLGFRHAFPTAKMVWDSSEESAEKLEAKLRLMGYGYRAPYIAETIETLAADPSHPFYDNYDVNEFKDYEKCVTTLQTLKGVGKKVADCIALHGFQFGCSVPIDVHIRRITLNEFKHQDLRGLKVDGSLTVTDYKRIGDFYRLSFGQFAGLAQQVMFVYSLHRSKNLNKPLKKAQSAKTKAKAKPRAKAKQRKK
ncbi:unnamed protein product, partial [Mesorhabditis belari]|uniref:DNA-(apurinic or apyrimidinic site) lyase n=1 Tax=Mesorhabditis belari TaxID=2138241 RepID=A0AAF3J643_9BILA